MRAGEGLRASGGGTRPTRGDPFFSAAAGKPPRNGELRAVKPLISIVTPTFHREDLLARCVQSVLAQQVDAPLEHIVVNDYGEPLAPAPWMDDPRVRVLQTFRTEHCVARNTGAALSQGRWLFFLD